MAYNNPYGAPPPGAMVDHHNSTEDLLLKWTTVHLLMDNILVHHKHKDMDHHLVIIKDHQDRDMVLLALFMPWVQILTMTALEVLSAVVCLAFSVFSVDLHM